MKLGKQQQQFLEACALGKSGRAWWAFGSPSHKARIAESLERRGLLARDAAGYWVISDAGRAALAKGQA